jgi:hypothetical protein
VTDDALKTKFNPVLNPNSVNPIVWQVTKQTVVFKEFGRQDDTSLSAQYESTTLQKILKRHSKSSMNYDKFTEDRLKSLNSNSVLSRNEIVELCRKYGDTV